MNVIKKEVEAHEASEGKNLSHLNPEPDLVTTYQLRMHLSPMVTIYNVSIVIVNITQLPVTRFEMLKHTRMY